MGTSDFPCEVCGAPSVTRICDVKEVPSKDGVYREYERDGDWHYRCAGHPRRSRTRTMRLFNPISNGVAIEGTAPNAIPPHPSELALEKEIRQDLIGKIAKKKSGLGSEEGKVIAFSDAPLVCVYKPDGTIDWWRVDLCEFEQPCDTDDDGWKRSTVEMDHSGNMFVARVF